MNVYKCFLYQHILYPAILFHLMKKSSINIKPFKPTHDFVKSRKTFYNEFLVKYSRFSQHGYTKILIK